MQTKKCIHCKMNIDKTSKLCPFCNHTQGMDSGIIVLMIFGVLVNLSFYGHILSITAKVLIDRL